MTPDDEFDELTAGLDDVADTAVDEAEADLQRDLLEVGCTLAEALIAMQSASKAGRLPAAATGTTATTRCQY
jgi:hypothetical protein